MKKIRFGFECLTVAVFAVVLLGCFSTPAKIVYDESVPQENQAELTIGGNLWFTFSNIAIHFNGSFDGKSVPWRPYNTVVIPAGEHDLMCNYYSEGYKDTRAVTWTSTDLNISYDFKPGFVYELMASVVVGETVRLQIVPTGITKWNTIQPSITPTKFEGIWKDPADTAGAGLFVFAGNSVTVGIKARGKFIYTDTTLMFIREESRVDEKSEWIKSDGKIVRYGYSFDENGGLVLSVGNQIFPPMFKQ